jgi:MFS transporter, DHA1 family, inner membrane transport protein
LRNSRTADSRGAIALNAPSLASASVSLNTSVLYVGQAIGPAIGGLLYAHELLPGVGNAGIAFVALALITVISTRLFSKT